MISSSQQNHQTEIDFNIETNVSQKKVISILKNKLPEFLLSRNIESTYGEDDISQEISIYLSAECSKDDFDLIFQYKYKKSRRSVDIGVVITGQYEAFFVIEAKILSTEKRKEYVCGNYGGIERFKREHHGKNLPISAMLGYVKSENVSHWHKKVNKWIDELINKDDDSINWNENDKLKTIKSKSMPQYVSEHSRVTETPIKLYHFWLVLNL